MTNRLFVYGTLAPGRPNEHILADVPGTWEPATVRGSLLREGWGAAVGYPGIVLTEYGDDIEGFLFTSDDLAAHWAHLDKFEGDDYVRVLVSVQLQDGATIEAHIYELARSMAAPSCGS
ncbi:gamma-glutamylcyclotransferase family protein [Alishewanella sp. HL-SH06]|uniref:gamma-glutamylcyclotransferase family protein n=1 Tax=Alishewanella sp. HL-SH06 TaxID=3461144 RepID=UPI00404325D7